MNIFGARCWDKQGTSDKASKHFCKNCKFIHDNIIGLTLKQVPGKLRYIHATGQRKIKFKARVGAPDPIADVNDNFPCVKGELN